MTATGGRGGEPQGAGTGTAVDREAEARSARAEIERLHVVIEAWFSGGARRTPEAASEFTDAQTSDFTLITTEAGVVSREELSAGYEALHGSSPGLRIRIEDVRLLDAAGDLVVAAFTELHSGPPGARSRRCTVVFRRDPAAPHGLRWRHLQETALPEEVRAPTA